LLSPSAALSTEINFFFFGCDTTILLTDERADIFYFNLSFSDSKLSTFDIKTVYC